MDGGNYVMDDEWSEAAAAAAVIQRQTQAEILASIQRQI